MPASKDDLRTLPPLRPAPVEQSEEQVVPASVSISDHSALQSPPGQSELPTDWPDPRGFVPPPPSAQRPAGLPQSEAVMTHTRLYDRHDADFTQRLANYYYFRDDARFGDWQGYLQRSDDFLRFCCHLQITEMLAARGVAGKSRVTWRWPIRRYER